MKDWEKIAWETQVFWVSECSSQAGAGVKATIKTGAVSFSWLKFQVQIWRMSLDHLMA